MFLSDLNIGDSGIVTKINSKKELKNRLIHFGIYVGSKFIVKGRTFGNATIRLQIGRSNIALRKNEADEIDVIKSDK